MALIRTAFAALLLAEAAGGGPSSVDRIDQELARLRAAGFPLVDYHTHLKEGLTLDRRVAGSSPARGASS